MFEFLKDLVEYANQHPEGPNTFYPVSNDEIADAEERLKQIFPPQLRTFFQEIGCGFLRSSVNLPESNPEFPVNRFLDPYEIADLLLGDAPALVPSEGFPKNVLPFFEVDYHYYLVIQLEGSQRYSVTQPYGRTVAPNLVTFVRNLKDDPRCYQS